MASGASSAAPPSARRSKEPEAKAIAKDFEQILSQ